MKKILFITSTNLVSNPRLLKELQLAVENDFTATVIKFSIGNWSQKFEQEAVAKFQSVNFIEISATRRPFIPWIISVVLEKGARLLPLNFLNSHFLSFAVGRRSYLILRYLKKIYNQEYDIVVAHNPQSFYPASVASKQLNADLVIDFEDYHRGEFKENSLQYKLISRFEKKIISSATLITTASPAITESYTSDFPASQITTINNVFPVSYAIDTVTELPLKPLKLFWFSQHIGKNRGLENIIQSISDFNQEDIHLTLLGSVTAEIKNYFLSIAASSGLSKSQLIFLEPVREAQIIDIAADHHIGIASEIAHVPNRNLCLTNKIFMYLLAGNALLLSNTKAQKDFIDTYPGIGMIYKQDDISDLKRVLRLYFENSEILYNHRVAALHLAKAELKWKIESKKWINAVSALTKS